MNRKANFPKQKPSQLDPRTIAEQKSQFPLTKTIAPSLGWRFLSRWSSVLAHPLLS
jgi:hypothetical protein